MDDAVELTSSPTLFDATAEPRSTIGRRLTLIQADGKRAVCLAGLPIFVYGQDDKAAEVTCIAMLSFAGLASDVAIANAFGCHRNTVGRLARRLGAEGMAAVVPAKRGPKAPSKVTPEALELIAEESGRMSVAKLVRLVAERTGVALSASHVRRLAAVGRPVQSEFSMLETALVSEAEPAGSEDATDRVPADDSTDDVRHDDEQGGPHGHVNETAGPVADGASAGGPPLSQVFDPPASPPEFARGQNMGLALYFPAVSALGVVDVARQVFSLPHSVRFGVRAVTLSLLFMTLLRKPTVESAKHLRRTEFGALIGTDKAPCVKTLRRKLDTLVTEQQAAEFGRRLARRWVEAGIVAADHLYVDGHMKLYTGKRRLQEFYNTQRRVALPGLHSYFVGDTAGRPLLLLTDELSANLANAMPRIVAAIREVLGRRQRFTLVFDRGGFDGKLFTWLDESRVGFITYQRGEPNRPDSSFEPRIGRFEGRTVRFDLAEDTAFVNGRGPWRRIVLRAKNGHQTPILTNVSSKVSSPHVACLMTARWRQENLFKYMGAHFGLDQLISYRADPADPEALIGNPERRRLERQIAERRQQTAKLKASLGDALLERDRGRSVKGLKVAQRGAVGRLRALEAEIHKLTATRNALPKTVPVGQAGIDREILRGEHKAIVDRIKISAYNAEEWLLDRLVRHYRNSNDVRDLLRSFAELPGEIRTRDNKVTVTLDAPDTPIHRRALRGLIAELNSTGVTYPGTELPVTYRIRKRPRATVHQARAVA